MNEAFKNGVQFAFDSTSIKLIETCPYKYKLKMIDGWRPSETSVHLLFGQWYATALEHFYKHRADGTSIDDALIAVVHEALVNSWMYPTCESCGGSGGHDKLVCDLCGGEGKIYEGGKPWAPPDDSRYATSKSRENLIRSIIWYVEQYGNEQNVTTLHFPDGRPAVEYSFRFEINSDILFCGHLDRVVEYSGDKYVVDNKTTGSTLSPYYFDQYAVDSQMSLYTMAGKIIFNTPIKGVMIEAAQVAPGFTNYMRGFAFRSEATLDEWLDTTLYRIKRFQDDAAAGRYPQNYSSCNNYGGCEFRQICHKAPAVREQFLKGHYEKAEPWNPLRTR